MSPRKRTENVSRGNATENVPLNHLVVHAPTGAPLGHLALVPNGDTECPDFFYVPIARADRQGLTFNPGAILANMGNFTEEELVELQQAVNEVKPRIDECLHAMRASRQGRLAAQIREEHDAGDEPMPIDTPTASEPTTDTPSPSPPPPEEGEELRERLVAPPPATPPPIHLELEGMGRLENKVVTHLANAEVDTFGGISTAVKKRGRELYDAIKTLMDSGDVVREGPNYKLGPDVGG